MFGAAWALAFALASFTLANGRHATSLLLILLGLLSVAYSREPLLLYLGWEVATVGLWLASDHKPRFGRLTVALHLAGLPFLMVIMLGLITPFVPPQGGVAVPWHIAIAGVMSSVVLMRVWLALLITPTTTHYPPLTTVHWLYAMAAPILLVKALVAAPFEPFGIWLLTLVGTAMLLIGAYLAFFSSSQGRTQAIVWVWIGAILAALGLASGTPLAAAGAVWLMLSGAFLVSAMGIKTGHWSLVTGHSSAIALSLALPGIWFITQGALDLRYGLVAALLLPCLVIGLWVTNYQPEQGPVNPKSYDSVFLSLMAVLALAVAAYPQLPVEFAIHPVVQTMAGGVRALSTFAGDWGVGLMVRPTQTSLSAGLPATGMMLAVFIAFVTLYWLRRLAQRFSLTVTEADAE